MDNIIGNNLKTLRKENGFTQEQLAEAVNVTTDHIAHVENGYCNLSLNKLEHICNALNVTPNDVMAGRFTAKEKHSNNVIPLDNLNADDRNLLRTIYNLLKKKTIIYARIISYGYYCLQNCICCNADRQ